MVETKRALGAGDEPYSCTGALRGTRRGVTTPDDRPAPVSAKNAAPLLLEDGDGETLAALATAIREDLLAAALRHASAKPVLTDPANVVRLISAFHGGAEKSTEERLRQEDEGEFFA